MKPLYKRLYVWLPLIIAASVSVGLWFGSAFLGQRKNDSADPYAKLRSIIDQIQANYVDSISIDSLIEKTLPELMAQLDPHSTYISAADLEMYNEDIKGSFSGIGIRFNMLSDTITVDEVISGGPSEKVGILAGDRIITIDDSIVDGKNWSNERILKTLRGPKETTVRLGIKRDIYVLISP